jgi:hypothetical protein
VSHRILLPVFAISLVVGCTEPGPEPEPEPSKPLTFAGVTTGDEMGATEDELHPIAVGGTQHVEIFDVDSGGPLTGQYGATSSASGVRVGGSDKNVVMLVADDESDGLLRIAATDGSQMDSIDIAASPVARVAISWPWNGEVGERGPVKLWNGTPQQLVIALYDEADRRLVDDSATIHRNGPGPGLTQTTWDTFSFASLPTGTTSTSFLVVVGNRTFTADVETVDAVDSVAPMAEHGDTSIIGAFINVCFVARSGQARVLGAPWLFTVSGSSERVATDGGVMPNCAAVHTTGVGTTTVTASIGETTASTSFEVRAP